MFWGMVFCFTDKKPEVGEENTNIPQGTELPLLPACYGPESIIVFQVLLLSWGSFLVEETEAELKMPAEGRGAKTPTQFCCLWSPPLSLAESLSRGLW